MVNGGWRIVRLAQSGVFLYALSGQSMIKFTPPLTADSGKTQI
jgi:hypothetical protein